MKICLKRLELINFGSWQHAVLKLESRGLVLIQGKTGAGKSTLFRALHWVLYGESAEGSAADEVINDQVGKNTAVSLEFSVGAEQYKVTRYRKHTEWKNKVVLWSNGVLMGEKDSKVEVINAMIVQVLSVDAETFRRTVYFMQRDTQRFPALTDAHQKRLIEAITDLAILPRAERVTRDQLAAAQRMQARLAERCHRYEEAITSLAQLITRAKAHASKELGEVQDRLREVTAACMVAERDWSRRTEHAAELREGREECARELHRDRDEFLRVGKQLEFLETSDAACPTCGSLLKEKRKRVMMRQMRGHQDRLERSMAQDEHDVAEFTKQVNTLLSKTVLAEFEQLKTAQSVLTNQVALHAAPRELMDLQRELASTIAKRDSAAGIKLSVERYVQRLEFWVKGFGRTGLRTLLLPQVLTQLTARTNYFLSAFDSSALQAEYQLIEGRIAQLYRTHGEANPKSYATLSGGERQMVEVCTSLALRELAETSRANELNCVLLDEPLEGLDAQLAQHMPKLLSMVHKASVFMISHSEALAPYFSTILTVRKTSHTSSMASI